MRAKASVCALILAAGSSSRMGAFKPLLPLGGSTTLEEAISRFLKAGIPNIKVVVGYKAELITPILDRQGIQWVLNERYDRGMLSSVLAGVGSLDSSVDAFFLLPVDIPFVKPKTIEALCEAYSNGDSWVIYPCFQGRRGHPPLISTSCIPKDLSSDYPGGLRDFLTQYETMARDVEVADEAILMDCDTPADYERLKAYAVRQDIPTEQECEALWAGFRTSENVKSHSRTVAQLARLLAVHLNLTGLCLNLDMIVAAGTLHDLAKGQPDHAQRAAQILHGLGYPQVGQIVASHMDIRHTKGSLTECDLVYLADKLVDGDQVVSLEDRFKKSTEKFSGKPEILKAVSNRFNNARVIQKAAEAVLGQPLERIVQKYERNIQAVSMVGLREIYLIRHGAVQSEGNSRRFIGQLDLLLSSEGIEQAQRLKSELGDAELSAVFCSDLKRSAETAAILAEGPSKLTPVQRPELREINLGQWDGLTFDEVLEKYPEEFQERGRDIVHYQPPGGESFFDCTKRVIPTFYEMLYSTRGNFLIVGHAGVNRILLCRVLGMSLQDLFEIGQDYGCLNLIHYQDGVFTLKVLNGKAV
jgi:molybdenum cofactor cytidylyltransferase